MKELSLRSTQLTLHGYIPMLQPIVKSVVHPNDNNTNRCKDSSPSSISFKPSNDCHSMHVVRSLHSSGFSSSALLISS